MAWAGNLKKKSFKELYLVKVPGELTQDRDARIDAECPEPFFKDAVSDHASIFSQFELADDAPQTLVENKDNVDLQGKSINLWAKQPIKAYFRDGGVLLGADMGPQVTLGVRRPRLLWVPLRDVSWPEYRTVEGVSVWSRVAIRRTINVRTDEGLALRSQYWSYELDEDQDCFVTVWTENEKGELLITEQPRPIEAANGETLKRLPFTDTLTTLGDLNINQEEQIYSLFSDVLNLNIEHYNAKSYLTTICRKSAHPTPMRFWHGGVPKSPPAFYAGPGRAQDYAAGSDVRYLEVTGDSIPQLRQNVYDLETKIKARDNRLFNSGGVTKSATEAEIENQKAKVGLPGVIETVESAFQDLFMIWELFANPTPADDVGGIVIDASVLNTPANPQEIPHYLQLIDRGIPTDAVTNALKRRGYLTEEDFEGAEMVAQTNMLPLDLDEVIQ